MPDNSFDPGDPPEFIRPINSSFKQSSMNGDHVSSRFMTTTTVVEDLIEHAASQSVNHRRRSCSHLNQSTECRRRRSKERKLLNSTKNSHSEHKFIQTNNNNNIGDKMPFHRPVEGASPVPRVNSWANGASQKRTPPEDVASFYNNHYLELANTDYTYSPLSPLHGQDLLPGIPQLPVLRRNLVPGESRFSSRRHLYYEKVSWWRRTTTTVVETLSTVFSLSVASVQTIFQSSSRQGVRNNAKTWWFVLPILLLLLWGFSSFENNESFVDTGALRQLDNSAVYTIGSFFSGTYGWAIWLCESTLSAVRGFFSIVFTALYSVSVFLNSTINMYSSNTTKNEVPVVSNPPTPIENDKATEMTIITDRERLNKMIQLAVNAVAENYTSSLVHITKEMHQILARLEAVESNVKALEARLDKTTDYLEEFVSAEKQKNARSIAPVNVDNIDLEVVKSIMKSMLETYHADRTGRPDFALQSNGGIILGVRCTKNYKGHLPSYYSYVPFWYSTAGPETIIKPGIMPGECWAFEGAEGYVDIGLAMPVFITAFTLEHTPKVLLPRIDISSAPKRFSVWGIESIEDDEMIPLGRFEFEDNGESIQTFNAEPVNKAFTVIELKIESNHGNMDYTCLYRFRVHGVPSG